MPFKTIVAFLLVLFFSWGTSLIAQTPQKTLALRISTPLEILITEEWLKVEFYLYNYTGKTQQFQGELVDKQNNLLLSGDWKLYLEQIENGDVLLTKPLHQEEKEKGELHILTTGNYLHYPTKISLKKWITSLGNYRFHLKLGENISYHSRLFRVVSSLGKPSWVLLSYKPTKKSYWLGEPITLNFMMRNCGKDEFHFEEGGDYRGATRHLRFTFTAENEHKDKAYDPHPKQNCFGGLGMADPFLAPGKEYKKELPLLTYLKFEKPGEYQIQGYQQLGFGEIKIKADEMGLYDYSFGKSFSLKLKVPNSEEATQLIETLLQEKDLVKRKQNFSYLSHSQYFEPLKRKILAENASLEELEALIRGIGSISSLASTKFLMQLAKDPREEIRLLSLKELFWRIRFSVKEQNIPHPFSYYAWETYQNSSQEIWQDSLKRPLIAIAQKGIKEGSLKEVLGASALLALLGELQSLEEIITAAERLVEQNPPSKETQQLYLQLSSLVSFMAKMGAEPCQVRFDSSPTRLALWLSVIHHNKKSRPKNWEALVLHMFTLESSLAQIVAIQKLPKEFQQRENIPWKKLLMNKEQQVWWYALQRAREKFPKAFKNILVECLQNISDPYKKGEFERVLQEIVDK